MTPASARSTEAGAEAKNDRGPLLKAAAYCAIALAVFVWFLGGVGRTWSAMTGGGAAAARVVEVYEDEREDDHGHVGTVMVAVYEFVVLDHRYRGKTEDSLSEGDTVAVVYDTEDPRNNRAKGDREQFGNLLLLSLGVLPFCYFVLAHNLPLVLREWQRASEDRGRVG